MCFEFLPHNEPDGNTDLSRRRQFGSRRIRGSRELTWNKKKSERSGVLNYGLRTMSKRNAFVYMCRSYRAAERAVRSLQAAHFNVRNVSIIGRDYFSFDGAAEASSTGAKKLLTEGKAFWNRMWRLLPGDAFLNIRGIGPIIAAGPISDLMRAAATNPKFFHIRSPLRASLDALGISEENVTRYEAALQSDRFLVLAHGNSAEVMAAGNILKSDATFNETKSKHAGLAE
jgi:hypothetical protein